ncbi:MAG: SH3 domain-containing protein [Bacillota bacterium]
MKPAKVFTKNSLIICFFMMITVVSALFTGAAGAAAMFVISGTSGSVNIREGPGTNYPILETVARGSRLGLTEQQSGWYKVSLSSGKTGWIASWLGKRVEENSVQPTGSGSTSTQTVLIAQGVINLRSGPGTNYAIVGRTSTGQKLTGLGKQSEWYKVKLTGGKSAWIAGWLVKAQTTSPAPTPGPNPDPSGSGGSSADGTVLVSQTVVNLRSGPGTNYAIVGRTSTGQKLTGLGKQGDWYKVSLSGGKSVWIAGWLVKPQTGSTPTSPPDRGGSSESGQILIAREVINLRSGPGTNYAIVGKTSAGQKLTGLGKQGEWYKVSLSGGKTAWIAGWLVKPEAPAEASAGEDVIAQQVLILRSGPGLDYGASGSIEKGQMLRVLDKRGEWYRISHSSGQTGWIAVSLVSRAPGQSTTPPVQQTDFVPRVFSTQIRVALSTDALAAAVSAGGDYLITNGQTGETISRPLPGNVFTITAARLPVGQTVYAIQVEKDRVTLGTFTGPVFLVEGQGATGNWFELNVNGASRRYRGNLSVRLQNGNLLLVNELPLEEYLYGVVSCEMPYSWAPEALKAQAVAARSYAFYAMKYGKGEFYDVFATQSSQVYRGLAAEHPATTAAVDATKNLVLTSGGYIVPAYFCSSNGGLSENSEDVWKNYAGPIRGKSDPYDRHPENPHYGWSVTYTVYELPRYLMEKGYDFSVVQEVYVTGRTVAGGRIQQLQVLGSGSDGIQRSQDLSNADWVRSVLGCKAPVTDMLKEYDPLTGALVKVTFSGSGWGHCLGMSQWGARTMAEQGKTFKEILDFYYTGSMLDFTANTH